MMKTVKMQQLIRDRRIQAGAAVAAVLVLVVALALATGRVGAGPASPTPVARATTGTATPMPTPSGTLTPLTASPEPAASASSAPVASTQPPATPTPSPDPGLWRLEGAVVNDAGEPIPGVCVAIGPHGCLPGSPHTDDRGVYYIDFPQVPTIDYDLHFTKPGYQQYDVRLRPAGPAIFNVRLYQS